MKNKETEQILLNDENYEKFLHNKTETEFNNAIQDSKKSKITVITDYNMVPREKRFSKSATYLVINKSAKSKTYVNGVQAEGFIDSNSTREKLLEGKIDYFVNGENYIKFYNIKLCVNS